MGKTKMIAPTQPAMCAPPHNNNNNNDPHLLVLIPHLPSHPPAGQRTPSGPALLDKLLSLNTEGGGRLISPLDRCKMSPDFRTIQKQSKNMKRNGEDRDGNLSSETPNLVLARSVEWKTVHLN